MLVGGSGLSGPADAAGFDLFLKWLDSLHSSVFSAFIDRNFDSVLDLVADPATASRLVRSGALRSLDHKLRTFFRDERLRRVFGFQALYAGVPPTVARALFAVITYMDTVRGVFYPAGGMHSVPRALASTLRTAGVPIHLGTEVREIVRSSDGTVRGVRLTDGTLEVADAIACTLDLPVAYERLFPELAPPRSIQRGRFSPSAVVWHLGVEGPLPAHIKHHNIHFGRAWHSAFRELVDEGSLMRDPSRLVTVPSVTDSYAAPSGCATMYVLEPVPHNGSSISWSEERVPMRERLLSFLESHNYPTRIMHEQFVTPDEWAAQGMHLGTPFALAHTFRQSGPMRPPNVDRRVPGLVFAGSGTTPGVGIPMVLLSGRLAAERVRQYEAAVHRGPRRRVLEARG